jgi:hypothetical protein
MLRRVFIPLPEPALHHFQLHLSRGVVQRVNLKLVAMFLPHRFDSVQHESKRGLAQAQTDLYT